MSACTGTPAAERGIPTFEVTRSESFVRRVTADGYLKAVEATPLTAPQDSERPLKIAWVGDDGSEVEEGDVVVRFDFSEMQRVLEDSQDDVTSAAREITKENKQRKAARVKRDDAAQQADREVETAKEFHIDDESILSRNEILETRIDSELASAKSKHARDVKRVEGSVARSKLDLLQIKRKQAENEVQRAKDGLANLEVKAPHDGILVLERDWRGNPVRVGDTVWRGQKLAELPLVTNMEAELFVLEADAGDLAVDQKAEVVIEAHPTLSYSARVKRVDTLAKPRHEEVPVQYFGITLEFEQTDGTTMKVGGRVRATINIEQTDVMVVPRQAVFDRDGKSIVHRATLGGFEEVPVELGSSSAGRVVIVSGLEPGDEIALRDPNRKLGESPREGSDAAAEKGATE